jgi:HlyD family secretion protein
MNADRAEGQTIATLFRRGADWHTFVVEGGSAHLRTVRTSRRSGRLAAVAEGVRPGETMVVYPSQCLKDSSTVRTPS